MNTFGRNTTSRADWFSHVFNSDKGECNSFVRLWTRDTVVMLVGGLTLLSCGVDVSDTFPCGVYTCVQSNLELLIGSHKSHLAYHFVDIILL